MGTAANPSRTNIRLIWIVVIVAVLVVTIVVVVAALFFYAVFGMLDGTDAHTCALAAARRSPAVARLVGTPIEQQGFTSGSSSSENGELSERITFTVKGPSGSAFVVSQGRRSPLASHLEVRVGRDQQSDTIYSGPFDCPELRRPSR